MTSKEDYDREIKEDEGLLASMPGAIQSQRMHVRALESGLKGAKRILRRMEKARRDLKTHLRRVKQRKAAYPHRSRRFARDNFGRVWDMITGGSE